MNTLVQVAYGRLDAEEIVRKTACVRCRGTGQEETAFRSGRFRECQACHGRGQPERVGYTYSAPAPVAVGDIVVVPPNMMSYEPQEATVIALESSYDGAVSQVVRVIPREKT